MLTLSQFQASIISSMIHMIIGRCCRHLWRRGVLGVCDRTQRIFCRLARPRSPLTATSRPSSRDSRGRQTRSGILLIMCTLIWELQPSTQINKRPKCRYCWVILACNICCIKFYYILPWHHQGCSYTYNGYISGQNHNQSQIRSKFLKCLIFS